MGYFENKLELLLERISKLVDEQKDWENKLLRSSNPAEKLQCEEKIEEYTCIIKQKEDEIEQIEKKINTSKLSSSNRIKSNPSKKTNYQLGKELILQEKKRFDDDEISAQEYTEKVYSLKRAFMNDWNTFIDKMLPDEVREFQSVQLFNEIISSNKLSKDLITEIHQIRDESINCSDKHKRYKWHERALIVSALTLSSLKNITSKKINLLLDFLIDLEEESSETPDDIDVWQRALVGIVLVLRSNRKWERFGDIKKRLMLLKQIPRVQTGILQISYILRNNLFEISLCHPDMFKEELFLDNPHFYFMPFYNGNQRFENAINETSINDLNFTEFEERIYNLPLNNLHKYAIIESLRRGKQREGKESDGEIKIGEEEKKAIYSVFNLSQSFHPFKNLITDFYHFFTYYPKNNLLNIFEKQKNIVDSKLSTHILHEKEKLFLEIISLNEKGKGESVIKKAISYLKYEAENEKILEILSIALVSKERYNKAILYLNKGFEIKPKSDFYPRTIAYCFFKKEDYKKAVEYIQLAIELNPNGSNYGDLGRYYYLNNEFEESIDNYLKAIDFQPTNHEFKFDISISYYAMDDYGNAIKFIKKAIELNLNEESYLYFLATYYSLDNKYDLCIEASNQALELESKNYSCYYLLCISYGHKEDYDKAIFYGKQEVKLNPNRITGYYFLGQMYKKNGDYEKALNALQIAKKIKNDDLGIRSEICSEIGFVYEAMLDFKNAISSFKRALELDVENIDTFNNLGRTYLFNNEIEMASKILKEGISIQENSVMYGNLIYTALLNENFEEASDYAQNSLRLFNDLDEFLENYDKDLPNLKRIKIDVNLFEKIRNEVILLWNEKKSTSLRKEEE